MATFTAFQALDMSALDFTIESGSTVAIANSTQLRIVNGSEVTDVFGTGLTYDSQFRFTGGTITGVEERIGGVLQFRLEGGSFNAATVASLLSQGPAGANALRAFFLSGNDQVIGSSGADVLLGANGHDSINGGAGNDTMIGGAGNDTYTVNAAGDVVTEASSAGTDTVNSSISYTLGANVERLTLLGSAAINGTGNALSNVLTGNTGANRLDGGAGNDILDGGLGNDTMIGGLGNDTYTVNAAGDVVTEAAGGGTDTVRSGIGYTLGATLENLTLLGSASINGTGNALSNVLTGNAGANRLDGGTGNDVLNGGVGNDTMIGGLGNDTYTVNAAGDVVTEAANGGTDTVRSSIGYTLGATLENLTLLGSASINGTGNALSNVLLGNTGANRLDGGAGNDVLNGGVGNDTMIGGAGNDSYTVNAAGDVVTEAAGAGTDTVSSSVSYTLSANVERLTLLGLAAINGTGNALANSLVGNTAANRLDSGAGNDVINGGAGADTMIGGAGNDTYVVDSFNDIVTETGTSASEIDTVSASVNHTLSVNVERLVLTGSANITGNGNQGSNVLIGNAGNNLLKGSGGNDTVSGGAGSDVLDGGAGQDNLTGGAGADFFLFSSALNASTNVDTVTDFVAADDRFDLDNGVFVNSGVNFGQLGAAAFHVGTAAADASDRVIYDQASGELFYDADGTGAGAQTLFARIDAGTALTVSDFFIA